LDVGCGVGRLALQLLNLGYRVDCVSPSSIFAEHARSLLGKQSHIFECCYEELQTENRYDLILFSESFQYINLETALQKSFELLNNNGSLLICDFFKKDTQGKCVIRGGRRLTRFYDIISQYPLKSVKDIDITKETAPNADIINEVVMNAGLPVWNLLKHYLNTNYRFFSKLLQWKYKKKIKKIERKYFSGLRSAENFIRYKSYRLLLYRKTEA
jgi:SAM-dependent methyltransferase